MNQPCFYAPTQRQVLQLLDATEAHRNRCPSPSAMLIARRIKAYAARSWNKIYAEETRRLFLRVERRLFSERQIQHDNPIYPSTNTATATATATGQRM